jgi:FHS family L-fucose permease-like MFS transporter
LTDTTISEEQLKTLSSSEVDALLTQAQSVQIPYIVIGLVVLSVAAILWKTNLPEIKESSDENSATEKGSIFKQTNLMLGVLAQFFYVGAQVCVSSFFIRFLGKTAGIGEKEAAGYLAFAYCVHVRTLFRYFLDEIYCPKSFVGSL